MAIVTHVAVLGAGIMGCCTALLLARRGVRVTLVDAADRPLTGASRWNEGKIHLGYLYAADPSLATAERLLSGGLAFRPLMEDLLGQAIAPAIADHDETYLVHRRSVVDPGHAAAYADRVAALVSAHPARGRYLHGDAGQAPRRLSGRALREVCDSDDVVAGLCVVERSVATPWIADRLEAAVESAPAIERRMQTRVEAVTPRGERLAVVTAAGADGPYDAVVNALWEGRLAVDATMGLAMPRECSHRYRVAAFVRAATPVPLSSAVVGTGPFGDAKRYGDRDLYLSWYPVGLLREGTGAVPPPAPVQTPAADAAVAQAIVAELTPYLPALRSLDLSLATVQVKGGWVYAEGQGALSDPASTLHRRDRIGMTAAGRYVSVDTGKYSIAPWLAAQVVRRLVG